MESIYMNRELSWLKFNARVLEEAESQEVPLCERMTFVSIYQSNLDEFFMVRVGSLQDQMLLDHEIRENKTNMTAQEQIHEILKEVKKLNRRKDQVYTELMKKIEGYGIKLIDFASAKPDEKKFLEAYFNQEIMPLSSPTIVAKRQPFPFLRNEEIYAVVVLETRNKKEKIGIIPCSNNMLPRMIELPGGKGRYMLLEELILHYIGKVFKGYKVKGKSLIRVVRNADIDADALYDEDLDYREFMADLMKQRKKLSPVRLDMSREMDPAVIEALCRYLEITPERVFKSEAPLDLSFIFQIQDLLRKNSELFYEKRVPQKSPDFRENESILDQIREEKLDTKVQGDSLVLTLNTQLQQVCYDALGDNKGAIVVLEPSTGKVLAMVSKPDFDPNTIEQDWDALINDDSNSSLFNRALQGQYPPGSTFKILTTLEYIREHPDDYQNFNYTCNGSISKEDVRITCYEGEVHGYENLEQAFVHSCNGAFAQIGMEVNNDSYRKLCESFLFNKDLPIDLPSSQSLFRYQILLTLLPFA